jgi:PAT family beta-lactamase induction signal transducer AmpG
VNFYLNQNRPLRLTTLCVLYLAQGIPDGFVRIALKTYLIGQQVPVEAVGSVVAMVSWPWALKFLWGPFIDRFGYLPMGRRRPWILAAQFGMACTLGAMLFIPELTSSIRMLALMVLLVNIFASLQDVSVDALAIDLLPAKERGVANGFMYGSNYAGSFIGGAILGQCILLYGFPTAVATQVSILLMIMAFPLFFRERRGEVLLPGLGKDSKQSPQEAVRRPSSLRQLFGLLIKGFSLRSSRLAALLAVLSLVTVNSHLIFWPAHVQHQLGWTDVEWLRLEGRWSVWFGLAGSLAGGFLASAIGARRTVALSLVLLATCWFGYAMAESYWSNRAVINALFLAESALAAFMQVSMFALFMGLCWSPIAATQFTTYMALLNVSNGLGARFAGTIESAFGMIQAHIAMGVLQLFLVAIVLAIDPNQVRNVLGETEIAEDSPGKSDSDAAP